MHLDPTLKKLRARLVRMRQAHQLLGQSEPREAVPEVHPEFHPAGFRAL
jgi:hypothetical protein